LLIGCDDSSLVIDKLCDEAVKGNPTIVCFYFDFAARNEQSPVNMLGSLLRQLVSGQGGIPEAIVQDFLNEKMSIGGRGLQVSRILKMFQAIAATRHTFICVDALDECVPENRMVVLESLGQILQESPNTRLFMTGRPHVRSEVERELGGEATFIFIRATEDGVLRFLREKLGKDTMPNMMSSTLEEDIMKSIPAISSETYVGVRLKVMLPKAMTNIFEPRFLLASLHIEAILRGTTIARRRKTLKSIKDGAGLGDAYGATLERINAQDEEKANLAMDALTWICHSERPLQVDELCHALAVEIGEGDLDPENIPSIDTLLDYCQGLIRVDTEALTVRLIHYTVQEYLCNHPGLFSNPHSILVETCLTYLNSPQVKNLIPDSLPLPQSMPFLKYSARYWGTHTNKDLLDNVRALALKLLNQYEDHISAVSLLEQVLDPRNIGLIVTPVLFSGLHCASFFGMVGLVDVLINTVGYEVDQQDCTGRTPLAWAARNGHESLVKILLERENVDPNRTDKNNLTPLGWAAIKGHEGVVKLLLEREDVDPNRPDKNNLTPLGCAAIKGHEAVVKLLLERGDVDPNHPDANDRTPLGYAAVEGHEGVVKLLLERGDVDTNRPDEHREGPLGWAAIKGHQGVVKLLLEQGDADPNRPDMNDRTPLGCAAVEGHQGVVRLLLERKNVDPNRPDKNDRTPLGCAAVEGHVGVVKLLLERGDVDPNRPDKEHMGPLGWAAYKGSEGVIKLLLERGDVDPDRPDVYGRTPLANAALQGHEGVVKLSLEREDVDPNHPDNKDQTPLGCASIYGHEAVIKLLLEQKNVHPNRLDIYDRIPLVYAAIEGHEGVVKLLLEREDVNPNRPDKYGATPLSYAARNRHEGIVQLLQIQISMETPYTVLPHPL